MSSLTILNAPIRQQDGLYSLNDLHQASGGEPKHQPNRFIRLDQTKGLIDEIINYPDMGSLAIKQQQGRNGGTYACKELVYAYAMWISPTFHLAVIRAFDTLQHSPAPSAAPTVSAMEHMALQASYIALLEQQQGMNTPVAPQASSPLSSVVSIDTDAHRH